MKKEDKFVTVDQSKAKVVAYIVVAAFCAIMLVFGIRSTNQTLLHEGDRQESITCKWCEGKGTVDEKRCRHCLGAKKLKAIIPGPNHPLRIRGTVWDLSTFPSREIAEQKAAQVDYKKAMLQPGPGMVGQAKLIFQPQSGEAIELPAKASGRFWGFIKPGKYKLSVQVNGFKPYSEEYEVPVREHPVWPKIPGVEVEDEDQQQLDIFLEKS